MAKPRRHEKSGVYAIEQLGKDRFYIGSSQAIYKRWYEHRHRLVAGNHHSPYLQHVWNKCGEDAFEFYILEECDKSNLLLREQAHLDTFKPVFNVCLVAGRITSPEVDARRAASLRARAALITHCPKGHAYDAENTYINAKGKRICRRCNAERVSCIYAAETPDQTAQRLQRNLDYHARNRDQRRAAMKVYAAAHKNEKRAYDRARRASL
jgi:group I intron endonuclease